MKPSILCIHGFAASKHEWLYQKQFFNHIGHNCYTIELIGHGEAQKPDDLESYHFDSTYHDVLNQINSLGDQPPYILVSHSLGCSFALRFANENPGAVESMVMLAPLLSKSQFYPPVRKLLDSIQDLSKLINLPSYWPARLLFEVDRVNFRGLERGIKHQMAVSYENCHPNIYYMVKTLPDSTPLLTQLSTPTLMIWGERDTTLPAKGFPGLVEMSAYIYGKMLPKRGHNIHLTDADTINQLILSFTQGNHPPDLNLRR